jgi:hypothetical protein
VREVRRVSWEGRAREVGILVVGGDRWILFSWGPGGSFRGVAGRNLEGRLFRNPASRRVAHSTRLSPLLKDSRGSRYCR